MTSDQVSRGGERYAATGFQMIRSIDVRNFRCYKSLQLSGFERLNVIVGDNGSGKTALLESIFLPLGNSTELGMRLRTQRGLDGFLGGTPSAIEEAVWGDFFYASDMNEPISLTIEGDGPESRSLQMARGRKGGAVLPLGTNPADQFPYSIAPVTFTWQDAQKATYTVDPQIGPQGMFLGNTGENSPDYFYFFASNTPVGSIENATRFSTLSKANKHRQFVKTFTKEFPWIDDLNVEVHAGAPVIFGSLKDSGVRLPLPNISSGINRTIGMFLAMAMRPKSIVIIDEIENGIYYEHMDAIWRSLLRFMREYDCQVIATTHSRECLVSLANASGKNVSDIALWRTERSTEGHTVSRFSGEDFNLAMEYGQEIR